jgi:hypothetical protein
VTDGGYGKLLDRFQPSRSLLFSQRAHHRKQTWRDSLPRQRYPRAIDQCACFHVFLDSELAKHALGFLFRKVG